MSAAVDITRPDGQPVFGGEVWLGWRDLSGGRRWTRCPDMRDALRRQAITDEQDSYRTRPIFRDWIIQPVTDGES